MKQINDEIDILETPSQPKIKTEETKESKDEQSKEVEEEEEEDVNKKIPVPIEEKLSKLIESPKGVQKQKKLGQKVPRCYNCRIKVGVYGMSCKCGHLFCYEHRLPENHVCSFDFKSNHQELLEKQNPKVSPSKYTKI